MVTRVANPLKGTIPRLSKIHLKAVVAQVAPELLTKQHLDIGLVVNNENKEVHVLSIVARHHIHSQSRVYTESARKTPG
jgi:hypothetical protein